MKYLLKIVLPLLVICLLSCAEDKQREDNSPLFDLRENKEMGVSFENNLTYNKKFNVYKYRNFYNGGGVALGDINNDGLIDMYLTANQTENILYLNKGDWQFEDVTQEAGVAGTRAWSTGTTMVDINADGYLDIYVCNSGDVAGDNKENELFINNGDGTFKESAAEYGLNDKGYSTHISFFDYDKDGDLDAYILNNSFQAIGSFNLKKNERPVRDELGGDKLMQNQNGKFVDVSEQAGIYGSVIGFGLGVTVGDVNNDGWEDIFVSNDFFERDYLYINNQDGTFKEDLVAQIPSISGASMGADIGDIDNDGYNDIFVTEMLPSDYERLKSVTTFESWDKYQYSVKNGYHHQYTRNVLHKNNGNSTYSEVSRYAGVEASDWSWGALFFDMDNDGLKDLYIANGIYKDLTDQDYLQYIANESVLKSVIQDDGVNYKELIDIIPSNPVPNHAFKNMGDLKFEDFSKSGLQTKSFSNGSAYGDLDNDGDLDLVVNNVNMPCFIYENKSSEKLTNNYLQITLKGNNSNPRAIGARVTATDGTKKWIVENQPARGFQSSIDTRMQLGLGNVSQVDIEVLWPDLSITKQKAVTTNQHLTIEKQSTENRLENGNMATPKLEQVNSKLDFTHKENNYVDFNKERLIYHMMSTQGPCASFGDLNSDGVNDIVIPNPKGSATSLLIGDTDGTYKTKSITTLDQLKESEHVECELFDADGDGDLDVYLASGGTELSKFSAKLYDKLLLNDSKGNLVISTQNLPSNEARISTSVVTQADVDGDGDIDLFVGERVKIGNYGAPCSGYILLNDGAGNFTDGTEEICPDLTNIGMVTDAIFSDMDGDGSTELIVVGEFMSVQIFKKAGDKYVGKNLKLNLSGWWNKVKSADLDGDGDQDLILANHGTNSRFSADAEYPVKLYYNDYDDNGTAEGIITQTRSDGKDYPYALRHSLQGQMPHLKKRFPDYKSFKSASVTEIFTPEELNGVQVSTVDEMKSLVLINNGNLSFEKRELPSSVQLSPMYAVETVDIDNDGDQDILMGGNLYNVQPEMGRYDASYGHVLINDGKANFEDKATEYGFSIKGETRDIKVMDNLIHVFRNNDSVITYKYKK